MCGRTARTTASGAGIVCCTVRDAVGFTWPPVFGAIAETAVIAAVCCCCCCCTKKYVQQQQALGIFIYGISTRKTGQRRRCPYKIYVTQRQGAMQAMRPCPHPQSIFRSPLTDAFVSHGTGFPSICHKFGSEEDAAYIVIYGSCARHLPLNYSTGVLIVRFGFSNEVDQKSAWWKMRKSAERLF